jgi:hypothetical protein
MSRYSIVMSRAAFLRSNREAMNAHLRKSKLCANQNCTNSICGFFHTIDDYKAPVCIYEEFCRNNYCTMYHPHDESLEEYIKRAKIIFPQRNTRRDEVMAHALLLKSDRAAMNEHLRKSKPCTNSLCIKSECGFAHSIEEFRPPVCIYQEFCEASACTMYHPHRQTIDQYIALYNISFAQPVIEPAAAASSSSSSSRYHVHDYPQGAFTKMCCLMTADTPCPRQWCSYAHSIYELHFSDEIVCYDYHENEGECLKFHPNQCKCCSHDFGRQPNQLCTELLHFVTSIGYNIEPFMTRHPTENRLMYVKIEQAQQKFIEEMKALEEADALELSGCHDNKVDEEVSLSISMSSLSIKSSDEKEEKYE